jgi:threonylcarbamoyladenosine tRNA methylthiotransferase MtaB
MIKKSPATIFFNTLGCKLNQAETEKWRHQFAEAGYSISDSGAADICVLNSCTVTHIADRKARHLIRLLRKNNPGALVVATGCYAEGAVEAVKKAGAGLVIGNADKEQLLELINQFVTTKSGIAGRQRPQIVNNRIRSFIKIQDGCQHFCTYCVVPLVRNREYSIPAAEIIDEINNRVVQGYQEVVLTGTEIGRYENDDIDLSQLVLMILAETKIPRLHLSSLQPQEINVELLRLWAEPRMLHHFHLALQSGSEAVLKRMGREYNPHDFRKAVALIRQYVPDAAITTDIMVGFPGESQEEFEESYRFCQDIGFAAIHVFSYSPRPGTRAASMEGQVGDKIKKGRSLKMLALAKQFSRNFQQQFTGKITSVLFENEVKAGSQIYSGFSHNYIRVFVSSPQSLANHILNVKLTKQYQQGLWGELVI